MVKEWTWKAMLNGRAELRLGRPLQCSGEGGQGHEGPEQTWGGQDSTGPCSAVRVKGCFLALHLEPCCLTLYEAMKPDKKCSIPKLAHSKHHQSLSKLGTHSASKLSGKTNHYAIIDCFAVLQLTSLFLSQSPGLGQWFLTHQHGISSGGGIL